MRLIFSRRCDLLIYWVLVVMGEPDLLANSEPLKTARIEDDFRHGC